MRKLILAAAIAATAAFSFAAPSQASGFTVTIGSGYGDAYENVGHYYGHRKHHRTYYKKHYYEPQCFIKKIRKYDHYGNLYVKRVKICK